MKAEQIVPYVGLPWKKGADGPDAYDCWGLLRHIQLEYFNTYVPLVTIGDADECKQTLKNQLDSGVWRETKTPLHGDGVLLKAGNDPHVGVFLDVDGGRILHSIQGFGVTFSPLRNLPGMGYGRVKYYQLHK